jgi:PTS system mannose-specific IIA component
MSSIGIVIFSHGNIGSEMVRAIPSILANMHTFEAVSYQTNDSVEQTQERVKESIKKVDNGNGVLILCDLIGATPCNVCRRFLEKERVAVVTGYNLPMIIKLASLDKHFDRPEDLANFIREYGQRNITLEQETK